MQPATLRRGFLLDYLDAFHRIQGWFSFDAALLFMAYHQLLVRQGISGRAFEIGVHHGLSTIGIAALRPPGEPLYAVDLFETMQDRNISRSGEGNRAVFDNNMRGFFPDLSFLHVLARGSADLKPRDLGKETFSFCHIDGGHSRRETLSDLELCHALLMPGGILALDDYFNPLYPGVSEGAVEFLLRHAKALRPLAIGFNKTLFQKLPSPAGINEAFLQAFPAASTKPVTLWDYPALLFTAPFRSCLDLHASTPHNLQPAGAIPPRALFEPVPSTLQAVPGSAVALPVAITNTSPDVFPHGPGIFGLSYHLLTATGQTLRHDNARADLTEPLAPGERAVITLTIDAPAERGDYQIEIDLIWEGVFWFRDIGNPTAFIPLAVV